MEFSSCKLAVFSAITATILYAISLITVWAKNRREIKALRIALQAKNYADKVMDRPAQNNEELKSWSSFHLPENTYVSQFNPPKTGIWSKTFADGTVIFSPFYEYKFKTSYMKDFAIARKKIPSKNIPGIPFESSVLLHAEQRLEEWLEEQKSKTVVHAAILNANEPTA